MLFLIPLLAFIAAMLLALGWRAYSSPGLTPYLERHSMDADAVSAAKEDSIFERRLRPWSISLSSRVTFLRRFVNEEKVEELLMYAGRPLGIDADQFLGLKVLAALAGLAFGIWWWYMEICMGPAFLLIGPIAAFFYPDFWLRQKADERQQEITFGLPDLMDLLSVCVQAGMGFEIALEQITRHLEGPLIEEVQRFLHEVRMGEPTSEALSHLARRNSAEDLRAFVGALIQAEELGVPIADTLHAQAEEMRVRRGQRAREAAAKAGPKISLVTVMIAAPSAMLLLVGAMILNLVAGSGFSLPTSPPGY